jgi:hypothetical protein
MTTAPVCEPPPRASDAGPEEAPGDWIDCAFEASDCLAAARLDRSPKKLRKAAEWVRKAIERAEKL